MKNKIILGDCLEVLKTLENDSVDVSFTSPPYNRKRDDAYEHFVDFDKDYLNTLNETTKELIRITKKDVIINVQQNSYNKVEFFTWLGNWASNIKGVVVWNKLNPQPNNNYREEDNSWSVTNAFEYFVFFSKKNDSFRCYDEQFKNYITTSVNNEHFEGHGAVMKYEIADLFIKRFSQKGDLVLDPFFGCGTTGIACLQNKRNYIGIEITNEYKEMAEKRIKDFLSQPDLFDFDY